MLLKLKEQKHLTEPQLAASPAKAEPANEMPAEGSLQPASPLNGKKVKADDIHQLFFVYHKKIISIYLLLKDQDAEDELHVKIF